MQVHSNRSKKRLDLQASAAQKMEPSDAMVPPLPTFLTKLQAKACSQDQAVEVPLLQPRFPDTCALPEAKVPCPPGAKGGVRGVGDTYR